VFEKAPFGDALADLLIGMIAPDKDVMLAAAAATLLARDGLRRFGQAWAKRPETEEILYDNHADEVLEALVERKFVSVELLHAIYGVANREYPIELSEGWERALTALYIRGGDAGRTVVLELLARHPYPKEVN
jgi:hypothetical protein